MDENFKGTAEFIMNNLRMKTLPVAVKFMKDKTDFPEKTRQPSTFLGKKITICQAVSMARMYGWTIGMTKDDVVCLPALIAFGFAPSSDMDSALTRLFCTASYSRNEEAAGRESASIKRLGIGEFDALMISPLQKAQHEPDTVLFYGSPAQVMRLVQAWSYLAGYRVAGNFGGKVECTEYLIAPFKEHAPRIAIPGTGDRVFSMTQDEEMVFALPGNRIAELVQGIKEAGEKVGARYPVPFYLNFQPEFPKSFKELGKELGIF